MVQFEKRCSLWFSVVVVIIQALGVHPQSPESFTEVTVVSLATSSSRASLATSASSLLDEEGSGDEPGGVKEPLPRSYDKNETRDALKPESSDQESVVFLSEKSSYIPVSIKPRSPSSSELDWREHPAWEREYRRHRNNGSRVQYIEAECQDDFMKIRVGFNGSFAGLVYSAGYSYDPDCMYINGSGRDYYEFYIQLNRCGTLGRNAPHDDARNSPTKNLMWNTITVQYNALIEEELDEHFKVTCEYGYDFWKTVTFPFLDVEVATGNPVVFTLQPPECYMEIRAGYGASGARVAGPVRVGDPLTLLIYMRSNYDGFDIVVNDCFAHNGATKRIQLIDENGCPVDDKLISRFRGSWSEAGVFETQVYAYMKTFRFTGSPALYIECDVRMCHGRCPTQPCHWRNMKSVKRRSIDESFQTGSAAPSESLSESGPGSEVGSPGKVQGGKGLSENINLFQSLRVLQEGEEDADRPPLPLASDTSQTCMKTSVFSTVVASGCLLLCVLGGSLLLTWSKLRSRATQARPQPFDTYVHHKGRIK